jgi:formylglycine-generating enzyme required for sulfatase activity
MLAMLGGAEDLASSWRPALAVEVPESGLAKDCGDGYLWVPPGPFLMGAASTQAGRDEQPVHVVHLAGFCLQRTEAPDRARPTHPAEGVSWAEAAAACTSAGGRLPTEAEWEKAARGGCELGADPTRCDPDDLRPYPWGKAAPTCALANHQQVGPTGPRPCHTGTLPIDGMAGGAGPYGHLHLSGNVWEYVADAYHMRLYRSDRPNNPGGPAGEGPRVLRGGGWNTFSTNMRVANRFSDFIKGSATGFRCVKSGANPVTEAVAPMDLVAIRGTIRRSDGAIIAGRSLYITAFDAHETDPITGMPAPGRSPVAEANVPMTGVVVQPFSLMVPRGIAYRISAALDDGSRSADPRAPASGSGGVGQADGGAIQADGPVDGISVSLRPLPTPGEGPPGASPHSPAH